MSRLLSTYVRCLLAVQILILVLAIITVINLVLHLGDFSGYSRYLPFAAFLSSIPVFSLAEDKNVWKNEFLRCPLWMRIGCAMTMIYGAVAASLTVAFSSQSPLFESNPVFASAVSLFIVPMPVMVLVSESRTGLSGHRRRMRYRISVAIAAMLLIGVTAYFLRSIR